jgi:hypothetical protein
MNLEAEHLNILYGLVLSFPNSGTRATFLNFIREETLAMGQEWAQYVIQLPLENAVRYDWFAFVNQPQN